MIIYGWGNYNKRNSVYALGRCSACGHVGLLHSFDAVRYFHLYYLPVIPYRRVHVADACPNCKRAMVTPMRKWKRLLKEKFYPAIEAYREVPSDRDRAEAALHAIAAFRKPEALEELAPQIQTVFRKDGKLLALTGEVQGIFGRNREAEAAYLKAVNVDHDPEIARSAEAQLERDRFVFPKKPNLVIQWLPVSVIPVAIAGLALYGIARMVAVEPQECFIVSGLSRPYDVSVNGKRIHLAPYERKRIDLNYGAVDVEPVKGSVSIPAAHFSLDWPMLQRPFSDPVFLVNPDRMAIIGRQEIWYYADSSSLKGTQVAPDLYSGHSHYRFTGIDDPFTTPPKTVNIEGGGTDAVRYTLFMASHEFAPGYAFGAIAKMGVGHKKQADAYLANELRYDEGRPYSLYRARMQDNPKALLTIVKARLGRKPIDIEWHRLYQDLRERVDPAYDLEGEYRTRLAESPKDPALLYLTGRADSDAAEADRLYRKSVAGPRKCAFGFYALASTTLDRGDFKQARHLIDQAEALHKGDLGFDYVRNEILAAQGDYAELAANAEEKANASTYRLGSRMQQVFYLAAEGSVADAETMAGLTLRNSGTPPGSEARQRLRDRLAATEAEAAGDSQSMVSALKDLSDPESKFCVAILQNRLVAAANVIPAMGSGAETWSNYLLVYVLAARAGQTTLANQELKKGIGILRKLGHFMSPGAALLSAKSPPSDEALACFQAFPAEKRVALVALATRFPGAADRFFSKARILNFDHHFPWLVLNPILNERSANNAPAKSNSSGI